MKKLVSILALLVALSALGMVILPKHIVRLQNDNKTVGELVEDAADKLVDRLEGNASADPVRMWGNVGMIAGVVAIVLGVVGFVRREDDRICGAAILVAAVAIAWPWIANAIGSS